MRKFEAYEELDPLVDVVVDDKFDKPHVHVYEHLRRDSEPGEDEGDSKGGLRREEQRFLAAMQVRERERSLQIRGDVGTGKSTFLRHVLDVHLGQDTFPKSEGIYIDWRDFICPEGQESESVHRKFAREVDAALERQLGPEFIDKADVEMFEGAEVFATDRARVRRASDRDRGQKRNELRDEFMS
ncbi:MAG: hypothetical protein KDK70_10800, partial [Myxococcales bacterium]|nr:hypothetical protein [Myxococcales bacterium]